ncbi:uncharacterized protein A1O9_06641 [Exophiala aquamarina CBS 119918]|uniref:Methylisocitrate lyase n=1 Tax=Exophiala aquamarina CBS 119918 TaxID=1182545 RepID=A0A072PT75_9EURO|nr:uncharacterized protein A1O9_06641 [Exophiala aquamarina CBS 119918]KEF58715.1 hypothetical protein A1O9_06641 [Exophiala aquamarina CBS 119918]
MGSISAGPADSSNAIKSTAPLTGAKRLRELLKDPSNLVVCPGVFDGLSARLAIAAGFDALYMTGAGTSMSRLGWADLGMATQNDMRANAEMIASLDPSVPLIADADTGYGGPIMVQEKRCGHLLGKQIVDRDIYYSRLRAAVAARDQLQSDLLIIARTDANQTYGFDEAIERLQEAVRIGVDIVFFEAIKTREEAVEICQIFKDVPVLLNVVPGGVTPLSTVQEAREIGFRMVIYPGLCLEPFIRGVTKDLEVLKKTGKPSEADPDSGIKHAFNLSGLQECIAIDKLAGGKAYAGVGN